MTQTDDAPTPTEPHRVTDRTGHLRVEDGLVVYDRENPSAWIRSDESVSLVDRR